MFLENHTCSITTKSDKDLLTLQRHTRFSITLNVNAQKYFIIVTYRVTWHIKMIRSFATFSFLKQVSLLLQESFFIHDLLGAHCIDFARSVITISVATLWIFHFLN